MLYALRSLASLGMTGIDSILKAAQDCALISFRNELATIVISQLQKYIQLEYQKIIQKSMKKFRKKLKWTH